MLFCDDGPRIAILFITEIDNMSYQLVLGEREKERVDTHGHIILTDQEAKRLSHTKVLCISTCIVVTMLMTYAGAVVAAKSSAFTTVLLFKLSVKIAPTHTPDTGVKTLPYSVGAR